MPDAQAPVVLSRATPGNPWFRSWQFFVCYFGGFAVWRTSIVHARVTPPNYCELNEMEVHLNDPDCILADEIMRPRRVFILPRTLVPAG